MKTLNNLSIGDRMRVITIEKDSPVKRKLLDMGIPPGVEIEVIGKAPLGDPIELIVRGYKLTLRNNEAKLVSGK